VKRANARNELPAAFWQLENWGGPGSHDFNSQRGLCIVGPFLVHWAVNNNELAGWPIDSVDGPISVNGHRSKLIEQMFNFVKRHKLGGTFYELVVPSCMRATVHWGGDGGAGGELVRI